MILMTVDCNRPYSFTYGSKQLTLISACVEWNNILLQLKATSTTTYCGWLIGSFTELAGPWTMDSVVLDKTKLE